MGELEVKIGKKKNSIRFIMSISFIMLIIITFSVIGYFVFSSWRVSTQNVITQIDKGTNKDIIK